MKGTSFYLFLYFALRQRIHQIVSIKLSLLNEMVKSVRILLLILFSTLLACIANAEKDTVEKCRNYLPEEIAALSA